MSTQPVPIKQNRNRLTGWIAGVAFSLILFSISFGVVAYRDSQAPDVFTDEILYTRAGTRIAAEGAMVWDSGEPFMIHPPLYFLVESLYFKLTSNPTRQLYNPGNIFSDVFNARRLNAIFAGLTTVLLFWIGRRLRGLWPALLMVALFIIDPFGVRINRRAMMETFAELVTFAGVGLFAVNLLHYAPKYSWSLWAGLLIGAGLLSKEVTFVSLLALAFFGIWEFLRSGFFSRPGSEDRFLLSIHALLAFSTALLTYAIYPLWVISEAQWPAFWSEKFLGVQRLLGLVQLTGWNRPGVSLTQFLLARLTSYGSSYVLLALGGAATIWILLNHSHTPQGRFIASWGLLLYPFFGFTALAGSGNDQLFYYLLVPAIFLVGYGLSLPVIFARYNTLQKAIRYAIAGMILMVMIPYDGYEWIKTFGIGQDNAYTQFAQYVNQNLPAGTPINATGDPIKFRYFLPAYPITALTAPDQAYKAGVHYYALAPKDVQSHYGNSNPVMQAWIQSNGTVVAHFYGDSYGDIYLYSVNFKGGKNTTLPEVPSLTSQRNWTTILPARTNFVGTLVVLLVSWLLLVGVVFAPVIRKYFDPEAWLPLKGIEHARETHRI